MSRKKLSEQPENLITALYLAGHEMRGGMTALAAMMPKNYNTLVNQMSPLNTTHHLKPADIERIVVLTQDLRIPQALASLLGAYVFKPESMEVSNKALKATSALLQDVSKFIKSLATSAEDDIWEKDEVKELEAYGHSLIVSLLGIMAGARAAYEESVNG